MPGCVPAGSTSSSHDPAIGDVTVCTLVRNRTHHLVHQVLGLLAGDQAPVAHVVAVMGGEDPRSALPATPWDTHLLDVGHAAGRLPLAAARNAAVRAAATEAVVLLDVDCIPAPGLVGAYGRGLACFDGILMGEVRYLPPEVDLTEGGDHALRRHGVAHPSRPAPPADNQIALTDEWHRFWSLSFGVRRTIMLDRIQGFDEGYTGYGAEDTDFALRAHHAGVRFGWLGGATAYHQHHATHDPPLHHLASIVANARHFHRKWGTWPMEGWLARFRGLGLVSWDPDGTQLEVLRQPTSDELVATQRDMAVPNVA